MRKREKGENPSKKPNNNQKKKIIPKTIKSTPESRLSDLEKTLDINIQILKTFYQSSTPSKNKSNSSKESKDESTIKAIENIKNIYKKKKELFNKLKQKKSKSLIEIQIYFEKKRKLEELKNLYQEKLEENEEGLYNKDENIKKVEKRLKEVEIYIHKLTSNMQDKIKQKYYQEFTIKDFLDINNEVARQKDLLSKKNNEIKLELSNTLNENRLLKMKNGEEKEENNENKIEEENNDQEEKIKNLTEKYENKIELINSKKNLLKNALEKMNSQFHLFDINKMIKKNSHNININSDNKKTTYNKKIIPKKSSNDLKESKRNDFDRMNSFLDISIINNKEDENNISKDKFGIMKTSVWDVSAINAKDISFIEKKDDF
jgi:hypothetical protein